MKRMLLIVLGTLLLAGCSPDMTSSSKSDTATQTKPAETSKPKTPPADPG
jgi:PBP1b-binding outer membrane lipoprotein LpoB